MNLVAKEFVASRVDGDGVLVLSEFAGAADELEDAVVVNPYDVEAVRGAIKQALTMDGRLRRERMASLRRRVREHDVYRWAASFIERLTAVEPVTATSLGSRAGAMMRSMSQFWRSLKSPLRTRT
jgi:trehalose-6-phosphate synthase